MFCKQIYTDPVLIHRLTFQNACRQCAIDKLVGKGPVKLPNTDIEVNIANASELRPNITLSFLLSELQKSDDLEARLTALLDNLSLYSNTAFDPLPFDQEAEDSVNIVLQAPERFSTFVDLVAVVDFSASMKGQKIALMKETLRYFISNLDENDRFGLVGFASDVTRIFEIEAATQVNKLKWIEKIKQPEPKNRSDFCGGLLEGLEMLGTLRSLRPNAALVIFTDGQATKGVTEEEEIVAATKKALQKHNLRVAIHTFGYRKHQVSLMKRLSEVHTGQYFFIQNPHQISESLAISFTDIRRCHFHDVTISVETAEGVTIKEIGTESQVVPLAGQTSLKKGCVVHVNQISERRQKNLMFRLFVPKTKEPIQQYQLITTTLKYLDSTLSLRRSATMVVEIVRNKGNSLPKENENVTTQWNRILTGQSLSKAANLGRSKDTIKMGAELLAKTILAVKHTDDGKKNESESVLVFVENLNKGKKILEKHDVLDDSHYGKMIDMSNAFLYEQSSVFVDAYNTEAVDEALVEIKENIEKFENAEGDDKDEKDDDDDDGETFGVKAAVANSRAPVQVSSVDPNSIEIKSGKKKEKKNFRLNTFKRFKPKKEAEISELYIKLMKGKLTPQEIEARLNRSKKMRKFVEENELQKRFKLQRMKSSEAYTTYRGRIPGRLPLDLEKADEISVDKPEEREIEASHQALYNFQARTSKEVGIKQGDPLLLLKAKVPNAIGYCEVENLRTTKIGLVPENFIAVVLIGAGTTSLPTHTASDDYKAKNNQEIDLKKGDSIMVTKERADGFFEGFNTRTEKTGLFPGAAVTPRVSHIAKADFITNMPLEVEIKKGDEIIVTKFRDDGWVHGKNLRTGVVGLIPSSFVTQANDAQAQAS